jgi:hypothetical protein
LRLHQGKSNMSTKALAASAGESHTFVGLQHLEETLSRRAALFLLFVLQPPLVLDFFLSFTPRIVALDLIVDGAARHEAGRHGVEDAWWYLGTRLRKKATLTERGLSVAVFLNRVLGSSGRLEKWSLELGAGGLVG